MKTYLLDLDGVLVRGNQIIPGADEFIRRLVEKRAKFLVLTNNSIYTPVDLQHRLQLMGIEVTLEHIYTSAMATATFLHQQRPHGTAFVVGEAGLIEALHEVGYVITTQSPDYVVLGETLSYDIQQITTAVRLVAGGARFIATNPDPMGVEEGGIVPTTGALAALIRKATGVKPYFVGKPNPLMMRTALRYLGEHSENAVIVGDRMDTDIVAGIESGLETVLVLTGVTNREDVDRFPYLPSRIVDSIADIEM